MGHYQFDLDYERSRKVEERVAHRICEKFNLKKVRGSKYSSWDFQLMDGDNKIISFELKEDFITQFTGNIAIEFQYRGVPSGIYRTKSDYYIYRIVRSNSGKRPIHLMFSVETLLRLIVTRQYKNIGVGGDPGTNTLFYLFDYDIIKKYAKFLDLS